MIMLFLILIYILAVFYLANKLVYLLKEEMAGHLSSAEASHQALLKQEASLKQKKCDLEASTLEIFTLYEMTKEITKSLNEEEAFRTFKAELMEHIRFEDCLMLDPLAENITE